MAEKEEKTSEQQIRKTWKSTRQRSVGASGATQQILYWAVMWARAERARRRQRLATRELEARLTKEFRELMANTQPGFGLLRR